MRIRSAILAAMVCASASAAHAQPIDGLYVSGGGGVRAPFPITSTSYAPGFGGGFDLNQKAGYDARLALGYAFGNGWRVEAELNDGTSNVGAVTGASYLTSGRGSVRNVGAMANTLFDLDIGSPYAFPYLGAGAGYQMTRLSGVSVSRADTAASLTATGEKGAFAAQAIAGVSFPIPNMPGLSVTADYRVMDILGGESFDVASSVGPGTGSVKLHNQFNQSGILSIRYAFNTPAPPGLTPPPAPAPTPHQARSYEVLFALGSAALDAQGRRTIAEAAQAAQTGQETRIEIAGNADTSGNARANQALSERRAKTVADALIRAGVTKDSIALKAYGDTKPQVPTGPGVADARNRRVEILLP